MPNDVPRTTLDTRYSEEDAQATLWPDAVTHLEQAGLFWVSTVRPDGRPHVTPVVAVWTDARRSISPAARMSRSRETWLPTGTAR
jgi:Pyridoxamine 5'-phosphate oxidase